MQAIQTTYKGPTNTKGSRIIAKCEAGRLVMGYDHSLTIEGNHKEAARLLQYRLGWIGHNYGVLVSGCLPNGDYAHVFTPEESTAFFARPADVANIPPEGGTIFVSPDRPFSDWVGFLPNGDYAHVFTK